MSTLDILFQYRGDFLYGLLVTLELCLLIWTIGIALGLGLGVAGARWPSWVGLPTKTVSFILSGVPVLVFLFWMHYPLQYMLGVVIEPFYTAVATLSIINAVLVADVVRGVLRDFPEQYVHAAKAVGLTGRQITRHIQLPIISRQILPSLLTIQISMLQATLFASLISVDEIFRIAQRVNSETYRPVEIYTALAVFFLLICLPLHGLAHWLRMRFTRNFSER